MFWKTTLTVARHNFRALEFMLFMMVMYLHLGLFSRHVMSVLETEIAEQELIEATEGVAPAAIQRDGSVFDAHRSLGDAAKPRGRRLIASSLGRRQRQPDDRQEL